jgi:hypothetical protein
MPFQTIGRKPLSAQLKPFLRRSAASLEAKSLNINCVVGGDDGTRTRGLCRDSEIFNRN